MGHYEVYNTQINVFHSKDTGEQLEGVRLRKVKRQNTIKPHIKILHTTK